MFRKFLLCSCQCWSCDQFLFHSLMTFFVIDLAIVLRIWACSRQRFHLCMIENWHWSILQHWRQPTAIPCQSLLQPNQRVRRRGPSVQLGAPSGIEEWISSGHHPLRNWRPGELIFIPRETFSSTQSALIWWESQYSFSIRHIPSPRMSS